MPKFDAHVEQPRGYNYIQTCILHFCIKTLRIFSNPKENVFLSKNALRFYFSVSSRVFHIEYPDRVNSVNMCIFSCLRSARGLACVPNTKRNSSDPFPNTFDDSFDTKPSIFVITPVIGAFRIRNVSRRHSEL